MKNKLSTLIKNRLRSVGMEPSQIHITRLLNHVVEKSGLETYIKSMSPEDVFHATTRNIKKTKPGSLKSRGKSFRLGAKHLKIIADISLQHGCDSDVDAVRIALDAYASGKIPAPISPSISMHGFDEFIKSLNQFIEALGPTARHAQIRHLPDETDERKAWVEMWHERASQTYLDLEHVLRDVRRARLGILACRDLDIDKLRYAEKILEETGAMISNHIKRAGTAPEDLEKYDDHLKALNELRLFLHSCGIRPKAHYKNC